MFKPGPLTAWEAAELNRLSTLLRQNPPVVRGAAPIMVTRGLGETILSLDSRGLGAGGATPFIAELTAESSGAWTWMERVQSAAGTWTTGTRSGTLDAYPAEASTGTPPVPAVNDLVWMRASPSLSATWEFVPLESGSGSSLQTINVDGSNSVNPTTLFRADQTTGVKFVGSTAGVGSQELEGIPSTTTQQGVVTAPSGTLTTVELQSLGRGNKQVYDGAVYFNGTANGTPWLSGEYLMVIGNATPGDYSIHTASIGYVPSTFVGINLTGNRAVVRAADPNGSATHSAFLFATEFSVVSNNQLFPNGTIGDVNQWYVLPRIIGAVTLQPTYAAMDNLGRTCFGRDQDINGLKFRKGLYIEPVFSPPPPPPITVPRPPVVPPTVITVPVTQPPPAPIRPPPVPPTISDLLIRLTTLEQLRAALPVFASGARGIVPSSGGGTTNYLRADGTWTAPSATPGPLATISVAGTVTYTSQSDMNKLILVSNAGIANTINLPAAATAGAGYWLQIKDIAGTAGAANITIDPNGAETIDGAATLVISSNYGKAYIVSNGSSWGTI